MKWQLSAALGLTVALTAITAQEPAKTPSADAQDFVFLAEARPLLVRVHLRIDGQTIQAAHDDFMAYLFRQLDINGDGVLSKDEAARAPSLDQILTGNLTQGFGGGGGFGGKGAQTSGPTLAELDQDGDGKVTVGELSAYYRKKGLVPFQFEAGAGQANPFAAFLGGKSEPSVETVRDGIFNLLDANGDGKLTRAELAAAAGVLLKLDTDDDEMVTASEIVPNPPATNINMLAGMFKKSGLAKGPSTGNDMLLLVTTPGDAPAGMVRLMQKRYGAKGAEKATLSQKDLNLDEATFAALDANGDGMLDAEELAGFVKRAPDLELMLRLGSRGKNEQRVELVPAKGGANRLADKVKLLGGVAFLNLGVTRVETRTAADEYQSDYLAGFIRPQLAAQFKQADKDGNGYLDEKEAGASNLFKGVFHAMDRDGDGKVTEQEFKAYLDLLQAYKERVQGACVTLVFADQSRGLFDLLDTDHDGRLSVREMRAAPQILKTLNAEARGFITRDDVPRTYRLTLKKGPASRGINPATFFASLYGGGNKVAADEGPTAGPLWFRKLDRNRDGDVSRREWFGTEEQFREIDTDGDGLISAEEAERYDARHRKE
jgi:Ca2+-binding EF-hand superfamily protein